jgi:hypothetical protein
VSPPILPRRKTHLVRYCVIGGLVALALAGGTFALTLTRSKPCIGYCNADDVRGDLYLQAVHMFAGRGMGSITGVKCSEKGDNRHYVCRVDTDGVNTIIVDVTVTSDHKRWLVSGVTRRQSDAA